LLTVRKLVKLGKTNSAARVNTLFTERNLIVMSQVGPSMNRPAPREADPAHWRQRAEDARLEAELAPDPINRHTLISIAIAYEKFAVIAEAKLELINKTQ